MDNQMMNQDMQNQNVPEQPAVVQDSSNNNVPYIIGAVVVIIVLALWYAYGMQKSPDTTDTQAGTEQTQTEQIAGDTTTDISADLDQAIADSDSLDTEASASAAAVGGL